VIPAEYENLLAFRTSLRHILHWSHIQAQAVGLTPRSAPAHGRGQGRAGAR